MTRRLIPGDNYYEAITAQMDRGVTIMRQIKPRRVQHGYWFAGEHYANYKLALVAAECAHGTARIIWYFNIHLGFALPIYFE